MGCLALRKHAMYNTIKLITEMITALTEALHLSVRTGNAVNDIAGEVATLESLTRTRAMLIDGLRGRTP